MTNFSVTSTTDDVLEGVDLTGTTVLITGNSAGLGLEATRALTAHGAHVIGGVRDLAKARANLAGADVDASAVTLHPLDLASLASAGAFTDAVAAGTPRIDAIIANAGIMGCPFGHTADGFELQFGTNHLGHFVVVNRLVPLLEDGGRIVTLTSSGHRFSDVDLDDPNFEHTPYDAWIAYGRSKTANALFAVELDRRLGSRGTRACTVHPGGIVTELGRHLTDETLGQLIEMRRGHESGWKTVGQGAATEVWAAVVADGDIIGGKYCEDVGVADLADDPDSPHGVQPHALDSQTARALWTRSEDLVGERFPVGEP